MLLAKCFHSLFFIFQMQVYIAQPSKDFMFLQCFAHWAEFFFSNMTLISIFHIDIQITYSLEHTGEVLLWSSSNEQEYLIRKTNFSVSCKFPILPWRFSGSGDFPYLKLSLMFIYEHYFSNRKAGVGDKSLNVRF